MAGRGRRNSELLQREIETGSVLVQKSGEGDTEEVKKLLEQGISVNAEEYNRFLFYKSQNYLTPLHVAASRGHADLVGLFIEKNAELNSCDRFDTTAVHLAAEGGHTACLRHLIDAGADCNTATKCFKQGTYTTSYTAPHVGGTTPLHLATQHRHLDCIRLLILNGADYNAVDNLGRTSLYLAAELGYHDAVLAHLHNAIGRDILSLPINTTGDTPLHECVRHGLLECVEELLRHGSDVNHRNLMGYTPLHLALHTGEKFNMDMVRLLVVNGYNTDVNILDGAGFHPLQYACFSDSSKHERRPPLAAFLIAYGAQYNGLVNKHGMTLMQHELQNVSLDKAILQAVVKTLASLPSLTELGVHPPGPPSLSSLPCRAGSALHQKIDWYRSLGVSARSLQHYCRCVLRLALGRRRLTQIRHLPLPNTLKDYLLLEYDEYR